MLSNLKDKVFFLGIGAQKAGTTWLHDYLSDRSDVFVPALKELHYLDARFRPDIAAVSDNGALRRLSRSLRELDRSVPAADRFDERTKLAVSRVKMIFEPSEYLRYFADNVKNQHLAYGEITPAYALLGTDAFEFVKSQFGKTKIVFLLRDPTERQSSAIRMKHRKKTLNRPAQDAFTAHLRRYDNFRSRYDVTFQVLDKCFSPEDVFVGFYETFFNDDSISALCDFLGIPFKAGSYDVASNASPVTKQLSREEIEAGINAFSSVYAFCRDRFGDRIPQVWHA